MSNWAICENETNSNPKQTQSSRRQKLTEAVKAKTKADSTFRVKEMKDNVVATLKHIREGRTNPKDIPARQRQLCVAYLRLEGYTQIEISEIFKVNRITIIRDEKIIRKEY